MKFVDEFRCGEPAVLEAIDGLLAEREAAKLCTKASGVLTEGNPEMETVFVDGVHVGTKEECDARAARLLAQAEAADPVIISDEQKLQLAEDIAATLDGYIKKNHARYQRKMMNELRPGKIVYYVHGLGENSSITKYKLTSRPFAKDLGLSEPSHFVDAKYFFKDKNAFGDHDSCFSLQDCNVIMNHYNDHRLFLTAQAAKKYLEWAKENTSAPSWDDDGWSDLYDPWEDDSWNDE